MIEKIKIIKNLAVFKDFVWDNEVVDPENNTLNFKKVNIIYGRNYSGKTTVSRIFRAMETGSISDKYGDPEFCVCLTEGDEINQNDFSGHGKTIRVFNDDFIKQNLKFIINQDEDIEPFAILGDDNINVEEKIRALKGQLGSDKEGEETSLYKEYKDLYRSYKAADSVYSKFNEVLDQKLRTKALDRSSGIKYQGDKFGDPNYTIIKLNNDINRVRSDGFNVISNDEKTKAEVILSEQEKKRIEELPALSLNFEKYSQEASALLTRKIGRSDKIEELVKEAVLNRWVKEGRKLHKGKRTICAFCNNEITDERWEVLDRHFDEESDKLEKEIDSLLQNIKNEGEYISNISGFNIDTFYSDFHTKIKSLSEEYDDLINSYQTSLNSLSKQLKERKYDILNEKTFDKPKNYQEQIEGVRNRFETLRKESNRYTETLKSRKREARIDLRLKEVYDFVQSIEYDKILNTKSDLEQKKKQVKRQLEEKKNEINGILENIESLQIKLKDESKGADKVNHFLNDFFGHNYLRLKAIEFEDPDTRNKKYRFEIQRDNQKAYHLSEGECSLLAFCYFMAKLQDIDTKSQNPIIWIDDPISSLDSNHIFFIYSLINTNILDKNDFEQLFISTHNLEFLKFLKRLPGANNDENKKEKKKRFRYLIIERVDNTSTIKLMPDYLRKFVTEFNYLFSQVYKCAEIEQVNDSNYTNYYNFGNNARKFLEIFLYYKYPDSKSDIEKMKLFFGDSKIPAVLTERINNEYSHLCGVFERGATVVEVPEMNKAAKLIIERIKKDNDQYEALLRSIGKSDSENSRHSND